MLEHWLGLDLFESMVHVDEQLSVIPSCFDLGITKFFTLIYTERERERCM